MLGENINQGKGTKYSNIPINTTTLTQNGVSNGLQTSFNHSNVSEVINLNNNSASTRGFISEFDIVSGYPPNSNMSDAYLSAIKPESLKSTSNFNAIIQGQISAPNTPESLRKAHFLLRHPPQQQSNVNLRQSIPGGGAAKKDKMEFNQMMLRMGSERPLSYHGKSIDNSINYTTSANTSPIVTKRNLGGGTPSNSPRKTTTALNRRSMPVGAYLENRIRDKFDISDLDTNLPRIDIDAIENHLRLAREEERKRRSDRDEIRRRLALESEEMGEKSGGRKPSLHSRLQSSMNLQICFMNETASDSESPGSDNENKNSQQQHTSLQYINIKSQNESEVLGKGISCEDFYARQSKLQADARHALSQAKDLAKLQMSHEKERRRYSPITEMVRNSLKKIGMSLPPERRRLSRQLLTEMNVAQLQVIVNDLHTHIEELNEKLVSMLLDRDDLHMEQDSMLVDIEDLTRYLAAKDNSPHQSLPLIPTPKSILGRK